MILISINIFIFYYKRKVFTSTEIFVKNLKQAYQRYFLPFYRGDPIELIVDGGSENNNRSHTAHKGLSPREFLKGIELDKERIRKGFQEAYRKRIEENRQIRCSHCEDLEKN